MGPSLVGMAVETVGPAFGLLGPGGLEKKLFDPCPLCAKRVQSAWEGELSGVILVGKDRDRGCISRYMTRRCVVVGSEIEADGCSFRIHRPYKTTGFAPRLPYFASSPLYLQPSPPIA